MSDEPAAVQWNIPTQQDLHDNCAYVRQTLFNVAIGGRMPKGAVSPLQCQSFLIYLDSLEKQLTAIHQAQQPKPMEEPDNGEDLAVPQEHEAKQED